MEMEKQELEILDEGRDAMESAITCCPTGSPSKIK